MVVRTVVVDQNIVNVLRKLRHKSSTHEEQVPENPYVPSGFYRRLRTLLLSWNRRHPEGEEPEKSDFQSEKLQW